MKSILCASLLILLIPSAYAASLPGDSADGKRLYDANCMGCHDTSVLTRKDRVVQSLDALKKQLVSCSHAAKKEFSASETQDLLKYLNDQFIISTKRPAPLSEGQKPTLRAPSTMSALCHYRTSGAVRIGTQTPWKNLGPTD